MSLGTNISRLRAEHHLSQGDLAEMLEVSRQSVSKWETDSSVPDLDKLVKLGQIFGVTLDALVTGEAPQTKPESPPLPVTESPRMPGRKIAGIVLFCMAFLSFLVLTVAGGILTGLILSLPFLVCGVICFLARKRSGLWCAWTLYLMADILLHSSTGLSWTYIFFTFSWEQAGTPVYVVTAWIQVLVTLVLLIGTVRSFRTLSFPPTRRNGGILSVLWVGFLVCRWLTAPITDLILAPGSPVASTWTLLALIFTVQGIVSLVLLAAALTLSVRMISAWRASKR